GVAVATRGCGNCNVLRLRQFMPLLSSASAMHKRLARPVKVGEVEGRVETTVEAAEAVVLKLAKASAVEGLEAATPAEATAATAKAAPGSRRPGGPQEAYIRPWRSLVIPRVMIQVKCAVFQCGQNRLPRAVLPDSSF